MNPQSVLVSLLFDHDEPFIFLLFSSVFGVRSNLLTITCKVFQEPYKLISSTNNVDISEAVD